MTDIQQIDSAPEFAVSEPELAGDEYLSFFLDNEVYGVEILKVQEIKGWDTITPIPNTPDYLCGVLNLRGTIVPVVDLRRRFEMPRKAYSKTTVIIVLKVEGVTQRTVGIIVDAVSDAHNVTEDQIRTTPDLGASVDTQFIKGLVSINDDMMMLLNTDLLLSVEALG